MTSKISEDTQAYAKGWEARDKNQPRNKNLLQPNALREAWLEGWDDEDERLAIEKNQKKA